MGKTLVKTLGKLILLVRKKYTCVFFPPIFAKLVSKTRETLTREKQFTVNKCDGLI